MLQIQQAEIVIALTVEAPKQHAFLNLSVTLNWTWDIYWQLGTIKILLVLITVSLILLYPCHLY